jgi:hypothetical protein
MKLWLVCFLILFLGAEAAQWLGQLPWIGGVELSLPLTVMGGVGLAIASNYRHGSRVDPLPPPPEPSPLPSIMPPPSPPAEPPVPSPQASRRADTISFEIKRPGR